MPFLMMQCKEPQEKTGQRVLRQAGLRFETEMIDEVQVLNYFWNIFNVNPKLIV